MQHGRGLPTFTTWLASITAALVLGASHYLDSIPDHSDDYVQLANIEAAQQQASAQARYERAVQQLCGPNAAWMERQDGAIQCATKRGTPTRRVTLTTITTPEASP